MFLGYISRSVAGSYDNEGIAIFCMLLTYYLWIKSVKTGSVFWSTLCALAYFYMVCDKDCKPNKQALCLGKLLLLIAFFINVLMHLIVPHFVILICVMPSNFTQGESAFCNSVNEHTS